MNPTRSNPLSSLAAAAQAYRRQWLSPARLQELQLRRLRLVVGQAWSSSPFYRDLWRAQGITWPQLDSLDDLRGFPVISKEDVHDRLGEVVAQGYSEEDCVVDKTSGSSGLVLKVLTDQPGYRYLAGVWMRAHMAYGLRPHHRMAYYRFSRGRPGLSERLRIFPTYHVPSDQPVRHQLVDLQRIRPHYLGGYPSHLLELAGGLPHGELRALKLRGLCAGSETLTAADRATLVEAFGCPVYDLYGCFEFQSVAFECQLGSRHLNADSVMVEVLVDGQPAPPGVVGDLVMTGLWNRAMPLVRYRVGDTGAWSDQRCPCGRGLPLLPRLEGRAKDVLVGATGRRLTQVTVSETLKSIEGLERYQLRQRQRLRIEARVVAKPGMGEEVSRMVAERLRQQLGDVEVEASVVDVLPRGPAGKVRPVISEMA